jgi:MerR family copper efflux transcriptional regulator
MQSLMSGELAKEAGVNVETLRFDLPVPSRRPSGYREYPPESVRLIRFIKRAQELGLSLGEIRELLALRVRPGTTAAEVREQAERKLSDIRRKVADLEAIERAFGKLTSDCPGHGPPGECPILRHLEGDS